MSEDDNVYQDVRRAVEQLTQQSEITAPFPTTPQAEPAKPMHSRDRRLHIYLGTWGAIFVAVIGAGVARLLAIRLIGVL